MKAINYKAPPTCGRFMQSASFGRLLAGPVGSGKTTACIFELLRRVHVNKPPPMTAPATPDLQSCGRRSSN